MCRKDVLQSVIFDGLLYSIFLQGCGGGNSSHQLTFIHGAVRFAITVISLPPEKAYANPKTDIWFWSRPKGVYAFNRSLTFHDRRCGRQAIGFNFSVTAV